MSNIARICFAICVLLLIGVNASGQQPDVLQALLTEVRLLRSSIERVAHTNATLQLAGLRASMQEERIWRISREVEALRTQLTSAARDVQAAATRLKQLEREIESESDPGRRRSLEGELPALRTRLEGLQQIEQQLRQREAAMTQSLTTEEGRWQTTNDRLDDLERRLAENVR
jgi:predicted  nucleic acid-binding Zn-ribbon protein